MSGSRELSTSEASPIHAKSVSPKRRSREGGPPFPHQTLDGNSAETADLSGRQSNCEINLTRFQTCVAAGMRGIGNRFVYVLPSDVDPQRHYVGITSNVDERLEWHNHGPCGSLPKEIPLRGIYLFSESATHLYVLHSALPLQAGREIPHHRFVERS